MQRNWCINCNTYYIGKNCNNCNVLRIGDIITVKNEGHIWDREIGLIKEVKDGFCKCEIRGKLVLIPKHWMVKNEH